MADRAGADRLIDRILSNSDTTAVRDTAWFRARVPGSVPLGFVRVGWFPPGGCRHSGPLPGSAARPGSTVISDPLPPRPCRAPGTTTGVSGTALHRPAIRQRPASCLRHRVVHRQIAGVMRQEHRTTGCRDTRSLESGATSPGSPGEAAHHDGHGDGAGHGGEHRTRCISSSGPEPSRHIQDGGSFRKATTTGVLTATSPSTT